MNRIAAFALLPAWAIHDAEEWATTTAWLRRLADAHPSWPVPHVSAEHHHRAILAMGTLVTTAAVRGAASRGRSPLYQAAVRAYGMHGLTHAAAALLVRGYAPGLVTTGLTVLPYAWWATRRFPGASSPPRADIRRATALAPAAIAACHAAAHLSLSILPGKTRPCSR